MRKLRIGIDGRTIVQSRSGVGTYAFRIVQSLLRIDRRNEYFLFLVEPNEQLAAPNLHTILITGYDRMILNRWWENVVLPTHISTHALDVYFSPAYALPVLPRFRSLATFLPLPATWKQLFNVKGVTKYVVTIHDVISSVLPHTFTPKMRLWQFLFNSNAVRVADAIITDSHSTKRDFMKYFGGDEGNIHVVHLSLDDRFIRIRNNRLLHDVRKRYSLPKSFILFVGTIEPRKNIPGLLKAYALLPHTLREKYPLVISGALGWYTEPILAEVKSLGISDSVHFIGYTAHEHLPSLYTLASLFVYPSLYEGFGYPPLEAMACGVPVITSPVSSLPEVVEDAAILVDPHDPAGLAFQMENVLQDKQLQQQLRRRGLGRAKQFGWRKTAEETLRILRRVAEHHGERAMRIIRKEER